MVSLLHLPMSYEASHFIVILPFCVYEIPPSAPAFPIRPPWHISAHSYCSVMVKRPRENLSPCSKRPPFPFFPSLVFTHKHASSPPDWHSKSIQRLDLWLLTRYTKAARDLVRAVGKEQFSQHYGWIVALQIVRLKKISHIFKIIAWLTEKRIVPYLISRIASLIRA